MIEAPDVAGGPPSRKKIKENTFIRGERRRRKGDEGSGEVELVGGSRCGDKNTRKYKKRDKKRGERKIKREFIEEGGGL